MKTKYDIGQAVTLKLKVTYISQNIEGVIKYGLMLINKDYTWGSIELTEDELDESNISD